MDLKFSNSEDFYQFINELRDQRKYEPTEEEKKALNQTKKENQQ